VSLDLIEHMRMKEQLTKNKEKVRKSLNVNYNIRELKEANCITDDEEYRLSSYVISHGSSDDTSKILLDILESKNIKEYKMFIAVMKRKGLSHIAVLLGKYY